MTESEEERRRRNSTWRSSCCNAPVQKVPGLGVICQVCGKELTR